MNNHKSAQSNKGDTNDISEILKKHFKFHNRDDGKVAWNLQYSKATHAIQNLLASQVAAARIDELENLRDNFVTPDKGGVESWTEIRIKELTADKEQAALQNKTNDGGRK